MKRALALVPALCALLVVTPAVAQDRAALLEEGQRAFMRNGCYGCHTIGAMGTPIARDLSHVGARYRPDYLEKWLRDPSAVKQGAHMPKLELTEPDIRALAAFLAAQE